eukprot:562853-Rhodomonas_salina.1
MNCIFGKFPSRNYVIQLSVGKSTCLTSTKSGSGTEIVFGEDFSFSEVADVEAAVCSVPFCGQAELVGKKVTFRRSEWVSGEVMQVDFNSWVAGSMDGRAWMNLCITET